VGCFGWLTGSKGEMMSDKNGDGWVAVSYNTGDVLLRSASQLTSLHDDQKPADNSTQIPLITGAVYAYTLELASVTAQEK
jgi:hypothetical protein